MSALSFVKNGGAPSTRSSTCCDSGSDSGAATGGPNRVDPAVLAAATPAHRPGTAQEVADGVVFLASDKASYITGSELVIDGGITAGSGANRPSITQAS